LANGDPIAVTSSNAFGVLVEAQTRLKKKLGADIGKYSLFAVASPGFWGNILVDDKPFYTAESRKETRVNGKIGKQLLGFETYESNNGYTSSTTEYLYFGVKKECLAGAIQKDIKLLSNVPDSELYTEFKGAGVYGVTCYDSRKFGTVKMTVASAVTGLNAA